MAAFQLILKSNYGTEFSVSEQQGGEVVIKKKDSSDLSQWWKMESDFKHDGHYIINAKTGRALIANLDVGDRYCLTVEQSEILDNKRALALWKTIPGGLAETETYKITPLKGYIESFGNVLLSIHTIGSDFSGCLFDGNRVTCGALIMHEATAHLTRFSLEEGTSPKPAPSVEHPPKPTRALLETSGIETKVTEILARLRSVETQLSSVTEKRTARLSSLEEALNSAIEERNNATLEKEQAITLYTISSEQNLKSPLTLQNKKELDTASEVWEEKEALVLKLTAELEALRREEVELETIAQNPQSETIDFQGENAILTLQLEQLKKQNLESRKVLLTYQQGERDAERGLEALKEALAQKQTEIEALEAQVNESNTLTEENAILTQQLEQLRKQDLESRKALLTYQQGERDAARDLEALKEALAQKQTEIEALVQEKTDAESAIADIQTEKAHLEAEQKTLKEEQERLTEELIQAKQSLKEKQAESEQALATMQEEKDGLEAEIVQFKANATNLNDQLAQSSQEKDALQSQLDEQATELEALRAELAQAKQDNKQLQEDKQGLEEDNQLLTDQVASLTKAPDSPSSTPSFFKPADDASKSTGPTPSPSST